MSSKPRRTSEFQDSTLKKPRVSRIATSVARRPSVDAPPLYNSKINRRATSVDPPVNSAFGSTVKRTRSTTPLRATPSVNTPLNRKNSNVRATPLRTPLSTCEKSKAPIDNKIWIQTQAERINEYLKFNDLHRTGIKSISTKQFISVVAHFLKLICGNRFHIAAENYVESVSVALAELSYPYTVNKSWLKTPNAPHSYNLLVVLLSWLLDFVAPEGGDNVEFADTTTLTLGDSGFPDLESLSEFMMCTRVGFSLWNNQQMDEFEQLKLRQVDKLVAKKTGNQDLGHLQKRLHDHEQELVRLKEVLAGIVRPTEEAELQQLEELNRDITQKCEKLNAACNEKRDQWKQLRESLSTKEKRIKQLQALVERQRAAIGQQKMTAKERDACIEEISYMKHLLNDKLHSVEEIQEMAAKNQILNSRVIKETSTALTKLSNLLCRIATQTPGDQQVIEHLKAQIDDNQFPGADHATTIERLNEIKMGQLSATIEHTLRHEQLQQQLKSLEGELTFSGKRVQEATEKMAEIDGKLEEVQQALLVEREVGEQKLQKQREEIVQLVELYERLTLDNERKKVVAEELQLQKQEMMQNILRDLEAKTVERRANLESVRTTVQQMEALMTDIDRTMGD